MNYDAMPRAELIAELKAWEANSKDKIAEKVKEERKKIEDVYKNVADLSQEEKYQLFWNIQRQISVWGAIDTLKNLKEEYSLIFWRNNKFSEKEKKYLELKKAYENFEKLMEEK